jgi:hypothetical protein
MIGLKEFGQIILLAAFLSMVGWAFGHAMAQVEQHEHK